MKSFLCEICGYVYDEVNGEPDEGIEPGTQFSDLDENTFLCPVCASDKHMFTELDEGQLPPLK